jgi:hypothetical protein
MKVKVDFTKLLTEQYWWFREDICLEMVNWFLKTGLEGDYEVQSGWYRSGINQLLYHYSMNNENYHAVPFPIDGGLRDFITGIFVRAIVSPASWDDFPGARKKIIEWRTKNKIELGRYRVFDFPHPSLPSIGICISYLSDYKGKLLKKEYAHPDFPERLRPFIAGVIFSTYGDGYFVEVEFKFDMDGYEYSSWKMDREKQEQGEYIGDFLKRSLRKLNEYVMEPIEDKGRWWKEIYEEEKKPMEMPF